MIEITMGVTEKNPRVVIGGTFDPVHKGHIRIAEEVHKLFPHAEINFMPAGIPSHRQTTFASAEQRLEMLTLALESESNFHIDGREINKTTPSYSIESIEEIRLQQPEKPLIWVMGRDAFDSLPSWHRATELAEHCHLLVLERPGYIDNKDSLQIHQKLGFSNTDESTELLQQCFGKVIHLCLPMLDISSTQVREYLNKEMSTQLLLADKVRAYIHSHKLYH